MSSPSFHQKCGNRHYSTQNINCFHLIILFIKANVQGLHMAHSWLPENLREWEGMKRDEILGLECKFQQFLMQAGEVCWHLFLMGWVAMPAVCPKTEKYLENSHIGLPIVVKYSYFSHFVSSQIASQQLLQQYTKIWFIMLSVCTLISSPLLPFLFWNFILFPFSFYYSGNWIAWFLPFYSDRGPTLH